MISTTYLAALFGTYILVVSSAMIFNRELLLVTMIEFIDSTAILFLTGILTLTLGISVVFFHNIWVADWRILVTLIGWIAVFKGAMIIIAPGPLIKISRMVLAKPTFIKVLGFVYCGLGLFFLSKLII